MKRASLSIAILLLMVLSSSVINAQDNATEEVKPLSPEQALASFELPDDLQLNIVVAEPDISQPVFFNFDERGRLWVMNYLQYPYPAGLKMVSRDQYWRAVYDKVPNAPPNHDRGLDRISIHTDADGDGRFETSKSFLEGLSIATSFVRGRGGLWGSESALFAFLSRCR